MVSAETVGHGPAEDAPTSRIDALIAELPPRQRQVLERRYGLNDHGVQTLAEIASEFGLTRERVRQIQSQALGKLRVLVERQA
jgi:RNA polymerase nonessential primary-like sigma factor